MSWLLRLLGWRPARPAPHLALVPRVPGPGVKLLKGDGHQRLDAQVERFLEHLPRVIHGTLRASIQNHGPVTLEKAAGAARAIMTAVRNVGLEEGLRIDGEVSPRHVKHAAKWKARADRERELAWALALLVLRNPDWFVKIPLDEYQRLQPIISSVRGVRVLGDPTA